MCRTVALGLSLVLVGTTTYAQAPQPVASPQPEATHSGTPLGQFTVGPLVVTPTFKIGSLAIDTNVQYERQKTTDFIASAGPGLDLSLPFHDQWKFEVESSAQYLYFLRTEQLRRWAGQGSATLYWKGTGTRAQAAFGYTRAFDRPSYEVNTRVASTTKNVSAQVERDLGRLTLVIRGLYGRSVADDGQRYRGTDISKSLTTDNLVTSLQLLYSVTPLSALLIEGGYKETRFAQATVRNFAEENAGMGIKTTGFFKGEMTAGLRRTHLLEDGSISKTRPYFRANLIQRLGRRFQLMERYDNASSVSAFARDGFLPTYENRQLSVDLRIELTRRLDMKIGGTRAHNRSDGEIQVVADSGEVVFAVRDDLVYDARGDIGIRLGRARLSAFVSYTTRESLYFSDFG
ncbi:MAG: outer membrane beta-barrel protein, partial [Fimbriimonadaceae bacterium]|nr:outer membrane beta-barrel protein [Fimbriimonadaceae bacterium]